MLDDFTLLVACSALLVMFGGLLTFLWWRDRRAVWLLWWGLPLGLNGVALTLYLRAGWQDDFLAIALGNAARIFAIGCLWYGIRAFQGRRPPWGVISGITLLWIALCFYPPFVASMSARVMMVSLLHGVICLCAVHELWRDRAERLHSRYPLMGVFASYGVLMLARAAFSGTAPFPIGAGPVNPLALGIFSWLVLGHAMFAAMLFLTMTLERREAEQRNFALSDPLTSLLNRRAFAEFAQRLNRRRADEMLSLLVLDLDHFKQVNDRFGHEAGDRLLKAFAQVAEDSVRPSDQLFRMGGEEFCFVLPDTSAAEAVAIAERIRRAVELASIDTANGPATTTVSIGLAATRSAVDVDVLLAAADAAVYEAKARGRNRVVVAEPAALLRQQLAPAPERRRA
ncbi:MAG: GGDEF domain-containing protein [Hyphomicrobiales bacterium]|nr:MAG: GGDEF domain-containing protein [Hyphomicrobiales bacterium]